MLTITHGVVHGYEVTCCPWAVHVLNTLPWSASCCCTSRRSVHNSVIKFYISLSVHLVIVLVNNQLDALFFQCIYLFPFSTSFERPSAHHQENQIVPIHHPVYRLSQEEWTKLRESVPYVEVYRYNPKHLYPKFNGYGDNGRRKVWTSGVSTYCTPSVTP